METAKTARVPKAGRPKKADVTSELLLALCLEQFRAKGFDRTTMRDLASAAGLSPGAFYYHFPSKEAVVQVFYEKASADFAARCRATFAQEENFEERLALAFRAWLITFGSSREFLVVLSRAAVDPKSTLSPFSPGTEKVRLATIDLFREMVETSDLRCDKRLLPYLPTLLWMYLMGLVLHWVFDESPRQKKTRNLALLLGPQLARALRFTRFPLPGAVIRPLLQILSLALPGVRA